MREKLFTINDLAIVVQAGSLPFFHVVVMWKVLSVCRLVVLSTIVSFGTEREREIALVHSASLAYEDGFVFMSMAHGTGYGTKVIKSIT